MATLDEVAANDYNLSPSRYVAASAVDGALPLEEAARLLREANQAREAADRELWQVLADMGVHE